MTNRTNPTRRGAAAATALLCPVALGTLISPAPAATLNGPDAVGTTTVVADTTTAAPDGNGSFSSFGFDVALNDAGQAAFRGGLTGTSGGFNDDSGIFRGDGTTLTQIARAGQAAPDNNGSLSNFSSTPALNDAGQAAFVGFLAGTSGGLSDDRGIFRGDGGTLTQVARAGQAAPDNNGSFSDFDNPALNDAGQAAFFGSLAGTTGGGSDNEGLFRGDGTTLTQIVRRGQAAPDGNGSFSFFGSPALNDAGQVAFNGSLTGTSGGFNDDSGIFRGDGTTLTQVARAGQAAPDGNGSFSDFFSPVLNDVGQAAFVGFLTGTSGGFSDDLGFFRGDGTTLTQIVRRGQAAPDGNGSFSDFFSPALNDAGQVAFNGELTGTGGGGSDNLGIFRGDGTTLTQVARDGQAAPTSDGTLEGVLLNLFFAPALNDLGQLAFLGDIDLQDGGSTSDEFGLFFYDDLLGLTSVARTGDAFDGSTIIDLSFSSGFNQQDEGSGLNNLGQVAYSYTLADGREGVAVWAVPEPVSAIGGLGMLSLVALRRRGTTLAA